MSCRNITSHNSDPLRGVQRADFLSAVNPDVLSLKSMDWHLTFYLTFFSETLSIWHILWRFISPSVGALSDILWLWNATNCMQMGGRDCCKIENGCINISWPLWKKAIAFFLPCDLGRGLEFWYPRNKTDDDLKWIRDYLEQPPKHIEEWFN